MRKPSWLGGKNYTLMGGTLLLLQCALTEYGGLKMKKVADSILTRFVGIKGQHDAMEGRCGASCIGSFICWRLCFQSWF